MKNSTFSFYDKATAFTAAVIILLTCFATANANKIKATAVQAVLNITKNTAQPLEALVDNFSSAGGKSDSDSVLVEAALNELAVTPKDIKQLISSAEKNSKNDIEDGKISEKQYDKSNAKIGNVSIRNTTSTQQNINFLKYYEENPDINIKDKDSPAVLIFHTHTTETYELLDRGWYAQDQLTRSNSADRNMIRVGIEIKEQLEKGGYKVIHDTEIHDTKYTGAYAHSRKSIEKILKENPDIQIVLDIHRDAIELDNGTRIKPTATVHGKKAAQLMIITGCEEGKVTDFPDWEYNLTFALKLQSVIEENHLGLMRPLFFCQRKYNMDLTHNNLLIEVGSCANTLEEAAYSGRLLGDSLVKLLDEQMKKED
ncbi:MAG: stage II sporulation protein P [Clostridia bacterium]|nr:stage II sporulation protein P [Clostridia bacterium]